MVGMVSAMKVAIPPTAKMATRITHMISVSPACSFLFCNILPSSTNQSWRRRTSTLLTDHWLIGCCFTFIIQPSWKRFFFVIFFSSSDTGQLNKWDTCYNLQEPRDNLKEPGVTIWFWNTREILDTCDLLDIWSEWWENMNWPKKDKDKHKDNNDDKYI